MIGNGLEERMHIPNPAKPEPNWILKMQLIY